MPTPVIAQPIMMAPGEAWADMSPGRLNTPPPIMEPTTKPISGSRVSRPDTSAAGCLAISAPAPKGVVEVVDTVCALLKPRVEGHCRGGPERT